MSRLRSDFGSDFVDNNYMSDYKRKVQDALKDREKRMILKHRYDTRITNVKQGKAAFAAGDFVTAIRRYTDYLEVLAEINQLTSIYDLKTEHFHKTKDITEIMMISHLYFELAKVYDATGKFQEDAQKCLEQFVAFSANQPFQVVNSEMARKHLSKFQFRNQEIFRQAYQQIFVKSRKCYVATHCFGDSHPVTQQLRSLKNHLLTYPGGPRMVHQYYRYSEPLVQWLGQHPRSARVFNLMMKPGLKLIARLSP